ncbi:uncharacterized protein LOC117154893 isoform X2 [Bombus vancouverensis nearcticus]|uniref:Uncharacterized protein LOC117216562 isoform X2 n=1 Tax=Bombus bifarius TaxID=103933 RepID=A0A6P8NGJ6_9HYME|nr:uncharacterized protein LOC117154893 isoform X2 [Bombus vancouverensis nearcticus]XP_033319244.1 uncharacterized protein LOC117216562 isoform X2 [Bombus bifarius]XP_050488838.1 uncharacterized protein LOC126872734 isoform X2 [Bombus huntii]
MALSIALPLSGLEADHFTSVGAKDLYEQGLRTLNGISGPISPSTASESSGICSLVPSNESSTPDQTSDSSRPETPEEEEAPIRIFYRERDILNLGANLREPFWQMRVPTTPRYDYKSFIENRSVYYRFVGEQGPTKDYPTKTCQDCGFCEPSPYLF